MPFQPFSGLAIIAARIGANLFAATASLLSRFMRCLS
jgi:hypothetical protein